MIFKSPHAAVDIPDVPLTDYVLGQFHDQSKPALIDGSSGRIFTYSKLESSIRRLSTFFAEHGVNKNDVFAIYCSNLPEYLLVFHAVAILGAVTTFVPPLFTDEEIKKQLDDSGARYILTIPQLATRITHLAEANKIRKLFSIGDAEGTIPIAEVSGDSVRTTRLPLVALAPKQDVVALPYSSGTTGLPKGVMLTHRNLVSMLVQMEASDPFTADDTLICVVPMYHLYGLHIVANLALSKGATVVTLPRFELNEFLSALQKYRITVAPIVPPVALALAGSPEVDNYDLSHLRLIHCGAATLAPQIAEACEQRLHCEIRYGYGMTEASPLSHVTFPGSRARGSVGQCLPNTECKIVDYTSGAELGVGSEGEIWIRGPQVMKGYLGNPAATAAMIDDEGWLRTGDIGYVDDAGRLYVIDRLKELIKYKGRQVAPAELEALLLKHPAVADVTVIPSPDDDAGEVPKAFIVLKGEGSAEEIMSFVAERVAPHKRVRKVEFVNRIPRSPAGKVLRRVLVQKEREDQTANRRKA